MKEIVYFTPVIIFHEIDGRIPFHSQKKKSKLMAVHIEDSELILSPTSYCPLTNEIWVRPCYTLYRLGKLRSTFISDGICVVDRE